MSAKESHRQQLESVRERCHVGCNQQGHRAGLPKLIGACITIPGGMDARHRATGFNVCPAGFSLALSNPFIPIISFCLFFFLVSFRVGMFTLCYHILEVCNFLFDFTKTHN
jgi:hypothetical protein